MGAEGGRQERGAREDERERARGVRGPMRLSMNVRHVSGPWSAASTIAPMTKAMGAMTGTA